MSDQAPDLAALEALAEAEATIGRARELVELLAAVTLDGGEPDA